MTNSRFYLGAMHKMLLFTISAMLLLWGTLAVADESQKIAVFYPQSKEPYRSIYQEIISGSTYAAKESKLNLVFEIFVLTKNFNSKDIIQNLRNKHIHQVIVLGRSGWKLAKVLSQFDEFQVVSGALPISPNGISGISLITDPEYLFNYLQQVAPQVKTIHVAYSIRNEWLIKLAKEAAITKKLVLNVKKVANTKEAITFYKQLFASGISNADAIWLPLDRISSHDKITLPLILERAWSKEVVVFSSKPSHAKRGVLFSTYPDNYSLGKHLFAMVQKLEYQPEKKSFAPLKSTLLAVNLRTAAHLGLKYSRAQQQQFKLTFPE